MKDIPAIVQSHMAKRIALYGQEPEQPLVEELFKRYSELQSTNDQAFLGAFQKLYLFMEPLSVDATQAQVRWSAISDQRQNGWHSSSGFMPGCSLPGK